MAADGARASSVTTVWRNFLMKGKAARSAGGLAENERMPEMQNTVIIQRVIPHYRVPLLKRLHEAYGWIVATSKAPPSCCQLKLEHDHPFVRTFDFRFPDANREQRCIVPVGEILRETRASSVIAEFGLGLSSSYELAVRRRAGAAPPLLFWGHGYNADIGTATFGQRMHQWPLIALLAMADGAITYGERGRELLKSYLPGKPIFVARNTIDISENRRLAKELAPMDILGAPRLISVGRLTKPKRFGELIGIFHEFQRSRPSATLTIIGDGPERAKLAEAAGEALGRSIFMPGAIYDETTLARYFLACDAFVTAGAIGLSINHALSYGLPAICYGEGGDGPKHRPEIAYVVDGLTGKRVEGFTPEAFVAALSRFFDEYERPRLDFAASITRMLDEVIDLSNMVRDFGEVDAFLQARIA